MNYDFSKFQRYNKEMTRVVDKITLTTSKQLGFPQAFAKKHGIHEFEGVVLYWEPDSKAIAVQFTNNVAEKGFIRTVKNEKYGAYAGISTFLATHSIDPTQYQRRYDYDVVEPLQIGAPADSKVFVLSLKIKERSAYEES
ncbi:hypothetical protein BH23PAT2_BH23PAT2_00900 [soil metagenome]